MIYVYIIRVYNIYTYILWQIVAALAIPCCLRLQDDSSRGVEEKQFLIHGFDDIWVVGMDVTPPNHPLICS